MRISPELMYYYETNQDLVESAWEEFLSEGEFGSGEDFVNPDNEETFWEFVANFQSEHGGYL